MNLPSLGEPPPRGNVAASLPGQPRPPHRLLSLTADPTMWGMTSIGQARRKTCRP